MSEASYSDLYTDIDVPPEPTEDDLQRARRVVASNARDAADATVLLAALGLIEEEPGAHV